jgi:4-hydroxybenzoyl-CoA thioesterase
VPAFELTLPVRFGQVDSAGIMFYPRFFENFHAVFEDMFGAKLGRPYVTILTERRLGFPMVRLETDFRKAFRFGDPMRLLLDVTRIGRTSVTFRYRAYNGAETEPSVEALGTVALIDLDSFVAVPFPADIRAVLEELLAR